MAEASIMNLFAKLSLDKSEFDRGLDDSESKAKGFGSKLTSGLGGAMKAIGAGMAAAGTAMVGFGTKAVQTGIGFDSAMSQVAATMGVTTDEIAELRDFAQEMGATTVFSATQSAQALNYMALAGYDAEKSMQMLPNVLNLAAAGGMDLARASDMVTDAESALGLKGQEVTAMVNQMARAASRSNTSVEQLGEAFLTIGGTATLMTNDTSRLATVLGILADNGIKGSEAGTHLRNMILKLSSPTKDGADAMAALGLQVFDAEGKMRDMQDIITDMNIAFADLTDQEKIKYISDMFNTRDVAAVNALLNTSVERWDQLGAEIAQAGEAADTMSKTQLDNLKGDVTLMKSAFEGLQIAVSDKLTPTIRKFTQLGSKGISNITMAFKKNGLNGAMEEFGKILSEGISMLFDMLPDVLEAAQTLLTTLINGIIENLPKIVKTGAKILDSILKGIKQQLPEIQKNLPAVISEIIQTLTKALPDIISTGVDILMSIIDGIIQAIPVLVENLPKIIEAIVKTISENVPKLVDTGGKLIVALGEGIIKSIPTLAVGAVQVVGTFVESLFGLKPKIDDAAQQVFDVSQKVRDTVSNYKDVMEPLHDAVEATNDHWNSIETLKGKFDELIDPMGKVKDGYSDEAKVLAEELNKELGTNIEIVDDQIEHYDTLSEAIEKKIRLEKADALLQAGREEYDRAKAAQVELYNSYAEAVDKATEAEKNYNDLLAYAEENDVREAMSYDILVARDAMNDAKDALDEVTDAMNENNLVIQQYSRLQQAATNDTDNLEEAMVAYTYNLKNATTSTEQELRAQYEHYKNEYERINKAIEEGGAVGLESERENLRLMRDLAKSEFEKATGQVEQSILDMSDRINNISGTAFPTAGRQIVEGLAQGIKDRTHVAVSAAAELARRAGEAARVTLDINSPSKVMAKIGQYTAEGFAEGIEDNLGYVDKAINKMSSVASDANVAVSGKGIGGTGTVINMNVYGAEGQDVNELAEIISMKINDAVARDRRVYA